MIAVISSEDFEITSAIREHVDKNLEEFVQVMPFTRDDWTLHFYLHRESERVFSANVRGRFWGKEFVATGRSENLYQAINLAKRHLVRRLNHVRGRRNAMKRKPNNNETSRETPWPL